MFFQRTPNQFFFTDRRKCWQKVALLGLKVYFDVFMECFGNRLGRISNGGLQAGIALGIASKRSPNAATVCSALSRQSSRPNK